jgi:hypothetical protein
MTGAVILPVATAALSTMGGAVGLMDLDIDGFLLSSQFLGALASAVSSLIMAFLNMFLFGGSSTA